MRLFALLALGLARASCDPPVAPGGPAQGCGFANIDDPGSEDPAPIWGTVEDCAIDHNVRRLGVAPSRVERIRAAIAASKRAGEITGPPSCHVYVTVRQRDGRGVAWVCPAVADIVGRVLAEESSNGR